VEYRLKKNADFNRVFKAGKRSFSHTLTLLYVKGEPQVKVGFTVTKKHGGAVQRNRIKRVFRAAFREVLPFVKGEYYIVFMPRVGVEHTFRETVKNMRYVLKKEGIIEK
jgi:ribonuclease P protein component